MRATLLLQIALTTRCSAFLYQQRTTLFATQRDGKLLLQAKASKKKRKKVTASSAGGFGKVSETSPIQNDDFSVFPALEKGVADTLIPSPPELLIEPAELPIAIYDRLDQIYGFPKFNYQIDSNLPLEDLISKGAIDSSKAINQPKKIDSNFVDLLSETSDEQIVSPGSNSNQSEDEPQIDTILRLPSFERLRVLHVDPLVIAVDDFFTEDECNKYIAMSTAPSKNKNDSPFQTKSMTVGKDSLAKSQRTSTTWFHHYKNVPELMAKASRLVGLDNINRWEEPQTVRYRRQEKFTWHLDALAPEDAAQNLGGQRTATLLVYLTDLEASEGGATIFRDLLTDDSMLKVQPKKGSAVLFFPAAGGIPNVPFDIRTLHCGEAVDKSSKSDKWICQLWLRESPNYTPSAPAGNLHASAAEAIMKYCGK
jgi:hypothetical protein